MSVDGVGTWALLVAICLLAAAAAAIVLALVGVPLPALDLPRFSRGSSRSRCSARSSGRWWPGVSPCRRP